MNDRPVEVVVTGAHKKPIPLGSEIYEQVLDDLRHAGGSSQSSPATSASLSSPASSTSSSSSSSSSRPCFDGYRITAKAELLPGRGDAVGNIGHTLDPSFRSDACQSQGQGRDLSELGLAQRGLRGGAHCGECLKSSAAGRRDPRPGGDLSELWPPGGYEAGRGRGQHPRGGQGGQSGGEAGRGVSAACDYDDVCCCGGPDRFREVVVEVVEEEEVVDGVVVGDLWQRSSHHSSDTMGHGSISLPHRDRRHCGPADTGGGDHTHLPQLSHHHPNPLPSHSSGKNPTSPGPAAARTVVSLPAAEPRQHKDGKKRVVTAKASHTAADAKLSGHVNGSPNLSSSAPAAVRAAPGHVVSWTFSSWCAEGQAKDFTNLGEQVEEEEEGKGEVEEDPGFLSSHPYPSPSRLYPPGSSGEQRETSPNGKRRGGSGEWNGGWKDSGEHLSAYSPSRPGEHRRRDASLGREREGEVRGGVGGLTRHLSPGSDRKAAGNPRSLSPAATGDSISQDVDFLSATGRTPVAAARGGSGNGSGCSNRSAIRSPSLPPLSGHAAESPSPSTSSSLRGSLERPCGSRTSTSTSPHPAAAAQQHQQHQHPHPHHQPHPARGRSPNSTNQHVRLCSFRAEDVGESGGGGGRRDAAASGGADDFSSLSGTAFRPRSVSDISVHAARRRQLPRRPPLQKQSRLVQEQEDHAHVHWADEERGSSLATSVLLTSIRPRALSHGSADLPRKPILKKPI